MTLDVLLEDNHLLALNKPAGLLTQADATGEPSLVDLAKEYLRVKYQKPGNVFVGLVHRLDRPVSGVVLLARTSKAAGRLSEQFRQRSIKRLYWAIAEGLIPDDEGEWSDLLRKDNRRNIVEVVGPGQSGKMAQIDYRIILRGTRTTWVELSPKTGRSHQLRVQLASRGWPILGDRKYGARSTLLASDGRPRIALHARVLSFMHPTRREAISVVADLGADWPDGKREPPG